MPITRLPNGKLLYFAHVPKCAGTAVERYLISRFGTLGMHDGAYGLRSAGDAWSLSPPQHMPEAVRRDLLPDALFDAVFATVRHPLTRLRSAFLFQRDIEKALPPSVSFHRWIETLPRRLALSPFAMHRHLRPMVETVPPDATVFRVEDGFDHLVDWLDTQANAKDGPREIATANRLSDRLSRDIPKISLTDDIIARVAEIYSEDYKRFGYPINPCDMKTDT